MMITKIYKIIITFLLLSFWFNSTVFAAPAVSIVDLPTYTNRQELEISYTALSLNPALKNVKLEMKKETGSWQDLGTYTTSSTSVVVPNSKIPSDGKYYFKATAYDSSNNSSSDETSTTVDRSSPPMPESFSKEKTGVQSYRISWHNPNSDDLYKTIIYRSADKSFTANKDTEVGRMDVSKNTDSSWTDAVVPDSTKTYYYAIRNIDRAGNVSDLIGDKTIIYSYTQSSNGSTSVVHEETIISTSTNNQSSVSVTSTTSNNNEGQILGEQDEDVATQSAKPEASLIPSGTPEAIIENADVSEEEPSVVTEMVKEKSNTGWIKIAVVLGIVIILPSIYFVYKRFN